MVTSFCDADWNLLRISAEKGLADTKGTVD